MSIWSLTYQQSAFKWCHSNKHSPSFTHNMTAKTSWHRRGTKLRHCHPMYTAAFCNRLLGQWRQIIHMSLTEVCSNPCVKLGRLLKAREDQICRYCGCCSEAFYKKLRYRPGTARCVVSIEILPIATQQCRNYLYKSWPNRWYEVGDLVGGNAL